MEIEKKFIRDVDTLVPCPKIALEVLALAHDTNCDIAELARNIEKDPSLTANMLRVANSAYFGHMKMITSIKDIIVRLGLEAVKLIAITGASVGLLKSPQTAYNLEPGALWRHSCATAILAKLIGRHAELPDDSALYSAALLHDIGKVILNRPLQLELNNREVAFSTMTLADFEQLLLGTNHARVGMALLQSWGLPDSITVPIGVHHDRDHPQAQLLYSRIVYLANYLVESMGIHSVAPEDSFFNIEEFVNSEDTLPEVPGFQENIEKIIEDFFKEYNDTASIFTLATLEKA